MIPRIIHRIWLDPGDDPMPALFREYGSRWRTLHPRWEVVDWTDPHRLPSLINQQAFDNARRIMPDDWQRFQADVLRLELVWQFGGVYADTDVKPLRPLDPLFASDDIEAFAAYSPNRARGRKVLTQAVIGGRPRHPFWRRCIDGIPDALREHQGERLAHLIGPHHVDRIYRADAGGLHVFPAQVFHPQSNRDRDQGVAPDLSGSYAWHRWNNSLRKRGKGLA